MWILQPEIHYNLTRLDDGITERLKGVLDRIEHAASRSGRSPKHITLVAVTKTISIDRILPLFKAGLSHFGENRVQEAGEKYWSPAGERVVPGMLHLIGHLQTNKAKKAVRLFDMVQSLDRWDLAQDLDRHARDAGKQLPCLVEVKLSTEPTKTGLASDELDDFLGRVKALAGIEIKGLMGIAPLGTEGDAARPFFARLRTLWEKAKLEILSMGMSSDFEAAIAEGSTMVRVGTALFGARR